MKRTFHARFVGVGTERLPYVDKRPVFGRTYTDPAHIEAELLGEMDVEVAWFCPACGARGFTTPNRRWGTMRQHRQAKKHLKAVAR